MTGDELHDGAERGPVDSHRDGARSTISKDSTNSRPKSDMTSVSKLYRLIVSFTVHMYYVPHILEICTILKLRCAFWKLINCITVLKLASNFEIVQLPVQSRNCAISLQRDIKSDRRS